MKWGKKRRKIEKKNNYQYGKEAVGE